MYNIKTERCVMMIKKIIVLSVVFALNGLLAAEDVLIKDITLDAKKNFHSWTVPEIKIDTELIDGTVLFKLVENRLEKTEKNFAQIWLSEDVSLESGKSYRLDFTLKASCPLTLQVNVMQDFLPNNHFSNRKIVLDKNTPQAVSLTVNISKTHYGPCRLPNIFVGAAPTGTILELSSVKLFEIK